MKLETIKSGTEIPTIEGYFIAESYNGHIVYGTEFFIDCDGNPESSEPRMLTLSEIGRCVKEFDGNNHNFIWKEN